VRSTKHIAITCQNGGNLLIETSHITKTNLEIWSNRSFTYKRILLQ